MPLPSKLQDRTLLEEASQCLNCGNWSLSAELLKQVTEASQDLHHRIHCHSSETTKCLDEDCEDMPFEDSEVTTLFNVLRFAGALWNKLMQTGEALQCLSLAKELLKDRPAEVSSGQEDKLAVAFSYLITQEYEIHANFLGLHRFPVLRGQHVMQYVTVPRLAALVKGVDNACKPIIAEYVLDSKLINQALTNTDLPYSVCLKAQEYLLHLIGTLYNCKSYEQIRGLLILWLTRREMPDDENQETCNSSKVVEAHMSALLGGAYEYCRGPIESKAFGQGELRSRPDSVAISFSTAITLWQDMEWPLEYTEDVISICTNYFKIRYEWLQGPAYRTAAQSHDETLMTFKDLHARIWSHMHLSLQAAENFHQVGALAHHCSKHFDAVWFEEKAIGVCLRHGQSPTPSMLRVLARSQQELGEYSSATEQYKELLNLLKEPMDADWEKESGYLNDWTIRSSDLVSQTYDELYNIKYRARDLDGMLTFAMEKLSLFGPQSRKTCDLGLVCKVARCYHQKATLLKREGRLDEAQKYYSCAKATFIDGASAENDLGERDRMVALTFLPSLLFWYGHLLCDLQQHDAAEQMFTRAIAKEKERSGQMRRGHTFHTFVAKAERRGEHQVFFDQNDVTLPKDLIAELELRGEAHVHFSVHLASKYFITLVKTEGGEARHRRSALEQTLYDFETAIEEFCETGRKNGRQIACLTYCLLGHLYRSVLEVHEHVTSCYDITCFEQAIKYHPCDAAHANIKAARERAVR